MPIRGCGSRQVGALYIRTVLSPFGKPIWHFLFDPPIPVPDDFDVPNRGVLIMERPDGSGIFDVYDRIGSKHYPNVADFIEEVRHHGLSRRVKPGPDLNKLTDRSRIFLIHERAIISNPLAYYQGMIEEGCKYWHCPCTKPEHADLLQRVRKDQIKAKDAPFCVGLWWQDVIRGELTNPGTGSREVSRAVGDFTYRGKRSPDVASAKYQAGIFCSLPIHRFDIISDPEGGRDQKVLDQLGGVSLPIKLEEE